MRYILTLAFGLMLYTASAQTEYKPEKGGMILYEYDNRFTVSDSAQSKAEFQFEDGTIIYYSFRDDAKRKWKVKRIKNLIERFGRVSVHVGSRAMSHAAGGWRVYNYNINK